MSRIVVAVAFVVVLSTAGQAAGIGFGSTIDHSNGAAHLIDSF